MKVFLSAEITPPVLFVIVALVVPLMSTVFPLAASRVPELVTVRSSTSFAYIALSPELVIIVEPELTVTLTSFAVTFTAVLGLV